MMSETVTCAACGKDIPIDEAICCKGCGKVYACFECATIVFDDKQECKGCCEISGEEYLS